VIAFHDVGPCPGRAEARNFAPRRDDRGRRSDSREAPRHDTDGGGKTGSARIRFPGCDQQRARRRRECAAPPSPCARQTATKLASRLTGGTEQLDAPAKVVASGKFSSRSRHRRESRAEVEPAHSDLLHTRQDREPGQCLPRDLESNRQETARPCRARTRAIDSCGILDQPAGGATGILTQRSRPLASNGVDVFFWALCRSPPAHRIEWAMR